MLVKRSEQPRVRNSKGIFNIAAHIFLISVTLLLAGCSLQGGVVTPGEAQATQDPAVNPSPTLTGNISTGQETATPTSAPPTTGAQAAVSLTFIADSDSHARQSTPDRNYGKETTLDVDSGTEGDETFIHFTLNEISGTVQSARLRLYTKTNGSLDGPAVFATNATWKEEDITWNNRPARTSPELANSEQINPESWVEYDVTKAVTIPGVMSFVLAADSGDAIVFSSREGIRPPELVVTFVPVGAPVPTPTLSAGDITFVGAGDIATCANDNDELTAQLLDTIPGVVFTAGDNVNETGAYSEFMNCYDPTWGRHKNRTNPVPGDHEYQESDSSGYYQYFNDIPQYYAYNINNWRIYALNSEIGVEEGSKQATWLKVDLAVNPSKCVLAYWHRPRWSSGATYGNTMRMQALWQILYDAGADLVINGFEHNYERFMPMDGEGLADPNGMRQFVVGTGGVGLSPFGTTLPTSQIRNDTSYGVLKLTLRANSYDWEFVPVAGSTFTDSGSTECR